MPKPAEALYEWIIFQEQDVAQSAAADQQEHQQQTKHPDDTEIARKTALGEVLSDQAIEPYGAEVSQEEFQAGVGSQADSRKFHLKLTIDSAAIFGFSSSHETWPFVVVGIFFCNPLKPQREAFFQ